MNKEEIEMILESEEPYQATQGMFMDVKARQNGLEYNLDDYDEESPQSEMLISISKAISEIFVENRNNIDGIASELDAYLNKEGVNNS